MAHLYRDASLGHSMRISLLRVIIMDSNQVHDLHVSVCVYVCFIVIAIAVSHGDDLADTILLQ